LLSIGLRDFRPRTQPDSAEQPLELTPFGLSETAEHLVLGDLHGPAIARVSRDLRALRWRLRVVSYDARFEAILADFAARYPCNGNAEKGE
jgi:hypothetical protein